MSATPAKPQPPVVGRFAPTPSGPLHFGSVIAAVASYLNVRCRGGRWLLRIDDLDPPRVKAGATQSILRTLEALGLGWDGEVVYQSARNEAYRAALEQLNESGELFACRCSRKMIGPGPYPGTCRAAKIEPVSGCSVRVRTGSESLGFVDQIQGTYAQQLDQICGDFVVQRADRVVAYHLAVVVDDAEAGVSEVIRGVDLLASTPRQLHLQRLLGLVQPDYGHLPVVQNKQGIKLSKQTGARAIALDDSRPALFHALRFLGLAMPAELLGAAPAELLAHAEANWRLSRVNRQSGPYAEFAAENIAVSSA